NIDTVIHEQRDVERRERRLDGARALDHGARVAALVAKLDQRRTTLRHQPAKLREIPPARMFGIDQGVEAKIDGHCAVPVSARAKQRRELQPTRSPLLRARTGDGQRFRTGRRKRGSCCRASIPRSLRRHDPDQKYPAQVCTTTCAVKPSLRRALKALAFLARCQTTRSSPPA